MYFILSKLLFFLVMPLNWVIVLLFIAAFTNRKKLRKRAAIAALIVTYLFSCKFIFAPIANWWDISTNTLTPNKQYSCAIVLGGFVSSDPEKNGHFNSASDRFIQGVRLFNVRKTSHILVSGGNASLTPDSFSEGRWTYGQLRQFNVPDSCILVEGKARNTMENAKFSKELLEKAGLKPPYLLVTSAFHMRRALMIFEKQQVAVTPYACDFENFKFKFTADSLLPEFSLLLGWGKYIKEFIGYAVNSQMH